MEAVVCQRCFSPLPRTSPGETRCTRCGARTRLSVFPALFKPPEINRPGEALMVDGQTSCFYHPEKAASVPCETCGRFLCALCDIQLGDKHVCPACLGSEQSDARKGLDGERALPDNIALDLSIVPIIPFFWWAAPFTAPMVLFICVRYWNAETSLVRSSRWRFIVALLLSGTELVIMISFLFFVILGMLV